MKLVHAIAALALALPAAGTAHAQAVGDWVLSPWQDSTMDFPGVIVARGGNSVTIRFDDGTTETRIIDEVRPFDWRRGSRISCRWSGDDQWYNATITRMDSNGSTLQIRYDDDGTVEETNTGRCRSR
jgi:hypothetical protein